MIPMHKVFMPDNIDDIMKPLRKVIESGWIGEGPKVLEFEKHTGDYIGNAYVIALNSCTSALQLNHEKFKIKTLFGVYGDERDHWIGCSKIVLSVYYYETNRSSVPA